MQDASDPPLEADLAAFIDGERGRFGDAEGQRILLALLRLVAAGTPVATADVAAAAEVPLGAVETAVAGLPAAWFEGLDDGRLVGFGGLSQKPTRHRIAVGTRTLYAWCAFDCLFLPGLLGRPVDVESTCPTTRAPLRLTVSPDGVEDRSPGSIVMSFVMPDETARRERLRQVFCAHINFFADAVAAGGWMAAAADGRILDLETACALARLRNQALFGTALAA
jgi:alkylmercury lyase